MNFLRMARAALSLLLIGWLSWAVGQEPGEAPFYETAPPALEIETPEEFVPEREEADDPLVSGVNRRLEGRRGAAAQPEGVEGGGGAGAGSSALFFMRWIAVLLFVVALIILAGYVARKLGGRTPLLAGGHLGNVLGRVHLSRTATLYYVASGGRVLVIGVTGNAMTLVAEFDAGVFDAEEDAAAEGSRVSSMDAEAFLSELQRSSHTMSRDRGMGIEEDDEISALRDDLQRLQRFLREEARERKD